MLLVLPRNSKRLLCRNGSFGAQAAGHQYLPFAAVAATLLGIGAVYWANRDRLSAMSHK